MILDGKVVADKVLETVKAGVGTDDIARRWPRAEEFGFANELAAFGLQFGHGLGLGLHERPIISRLKDEVDAARFSNWSHILFDQATLAEGGQLDDPATFVKRLNELMLTLEVGGKRKPGTYGIVVGRSWAADLRAGRPGPCTELIILHVKPPKP